MIKNDESSVHADHICLRQNGRTSSSVSERCIKKWREFRPCRSHFFEAKRPHSIQRVRQVHRKIGEHSIHVHDCFANTSAIDTGSRERGRRHGVSHSISDNQFYQLECNCIPRIRRTQEDLHSDLPHMLKSLSTHPF